MSNAYINDYNRTVKAYYNELKECNPISREEEIELLKKVKENDIDARNKILTSNLKFVFDIAKKYKGRGVPMDELISEGNAGLIKALSKFDGSKNVKFITYAIWWIKYYISSYIECRNETQTNEISKSDEETNDIEEKYSNDSYYESSCEVYDAEDIDIDNTDKEINRKKILSYLLGTVQRKRIRYFDIILWVKW